MYVRSCLLLGPSFFISALPPVRAIRRDRFFLSEEVLRTKVRHQCRETSSNPRRPRRHTQNNLSILITSHTTTTTRATMNIYVIFSLLFILKAQKLNRNISITSNTTTTHVRRRRCLIENKCLFVLILSTTQIKIINICNCYDVHDVNLFRVVG